MPMRSACRNRTPHSGNPHLISPDRNSLAISPDGHLFPVTFENLVSQAIRNTFRVNR